MTYRRPKRTQTFEIKIPELRITITVAVLSVAAAVIVTWVYGKASPGNRDVIRFATTSLSVAAAITSASYIGRGLRLNAQSEKETRTLAFPARWNHSSNSNTKSSVRGFLKELENIPEKERREYIETKFDADGDLKTRITDALNFLEEMAVCVEMEIVDETLLRDFFLSIVIKYYDIMRPWIDSRRGINSRIYKSLTNLYNRWRKL